MPKLASESQAIVATIDPDANAAGALTSDWVDMGDWERIQALILTGTLGSSATVDAKLQQATDSSGTGAKDITGKAITQMTQAGTDQSDDQAVINCTSAELDIAGGFNHVALVLTTGTATSDSAGVVLGMGARQGPASDQQLASVGEVIN